MIQRLDEHDQNYLVPYAQRKRDWTRLDWTDFIIRTIMLCVFACIVFWTIVWIVCNLWK